MSTWISMATTQPLGPTKWASASVSCPLPHVASMTMSPVDTKPDHAALAASVMRAPPVSSARSELACACGSAATASCSAVCATAAGTVSGLSDACNATPVVWLLHQPTGRQLSTCIADSGTSCGRWHLRHAICTASLSRLVSWWHGSGFLSARFAICDSCWQPAGAAGRSRQSC